MTCSTTSIPTRDVATAGSDDRPARALLLDGDPALCRQMGLALRSLGIESETFCDAESALRSAQDVLYAVAIVDVGIEHGYEACRSLARGETGQRIPVLAFASSGSFLERLKARRHGARGLVTKPAPLDYFLQAVWRTARGPQRHAAAAQDRDMGLPSRA